MQSPFIEKSIHQSSLIKKKIIEKDEKEKNLRKIYKTKKIPILEGNLSVNLYMICQRCLEVFEFPLNISLKYAFLIRENNFAKNIKYEIWELSNEKLNIYDFIEEILIISIPLYPSHKSNENCNLLLNNVDGKNKNKPFSSLKDLIK